MQTAMAVAASVIGERASTECNPGRGDGRSHCSRKYHGQDRSDTVPQRVPIGIKQWCI